MKICGIQFRPICCRSEIVQGCTRINEVYTGIFIVQRRICSDVYYRFPLSLTADLKTYSSRQNITADTGRIMIAFPYPVFSTTSP